MNQDITSLPYLSAHENYELLKYAYLFYKIQTLLHKVKIK